MIYIVTFEIHRNCQIKNMVFYCKAKNAKEACVIAKGLWQLCGGQGHQFHIHAVKSRIQDQEYLGVRNWKGQEVKGGGLLNRFICTNSRTWRVNGRNLY